jgi:phosphotransferase system HPr (HPr) family protein
MGVKRQPVRCPKRNFRLIIINSQPLGIHINTLTKRIIVSNPLGIHARPAALIAKLASTSAGKVWLIKEGEMVDAGSIIDILTLGCSKGTEVILKMESIGDEKLFMEIAGLIELGIDE